MFSRFSGANPPHHSLVDSDEMSVKLADLDKDIAKLTAAIAVVLASIVTMAIFVL